MPNLPTSKLVPYAWSDLFNLVLDLKTGHLQSASRQNLS